MVAELLVPVATSLALMNGEEAPAVLKSVAPNAWVPASAVVNV
jgi:hypothetical protein